MKRYLIALMVVVFVASGCAGSSPQAGPENSSTSDGPEGVSDGPGGTAALPAGYESMTAEKKYASLANRSSNSTYHIEYGMSFDAGLESDIMSEAFESADVDLYSYEGSIKSLVTISLMGTTSTSATFPIRDANYSVQCQETSGLSTGSMTCSLSESSTGGSSMMATSPSQDFTDSLDEVEVSYEGMKTIAGRECGSFDLSMPSELLNQSNVQGDVTGHFCIDRQKGYMARMAVDMTMSTTQLGGTRDVHLGFNATDYDSDVTRSDIEVPRDLVAGLNCENGMNARIYASEYSGDLDIDINEQTVQGEIERGEIKAFNLTQYRVDGSNTLNVTAGGEHYSDTCYHLDYESNYGL